MKKILLRPAWFVGLIWFKLLPKSLSQQTSLTRLGDELRPAKHFRLVLDMFLAAGLTHVGNHPKVVYLVTLV